MRVQRREDTLARAPCAWTFRGRDSPEARRAARTEAHGVIHVWGVVLDFEPRRGDQNRPRWGLVWQNARRLAGRNPSGRPSGALGFLWAWSTRLTPWARVLPPHPGLLTRGSKRAPCSKPTCSRTMNPGIPGGETPPSTAGGTPAATDGLVHGAVLSKCRFQNRSMASRRWRVVPCPSPMPWERFG